MTEDLKEMIKMELSKRSSVFLKKLRSGMRDEGLRAGRAKRIKKQIDDNAN